jgi:hypothetical protein
MKKLKKLILVLFVMVFTSLISNAQEVGLRFGDVSGGNVAVDGVFSMGEFNRLHADVSFGKGVGVDVLWDFLYRPIADEVINWYVGVGPYTFLGKPFELGIVGEIGLEHRFNSIPLVLGVDWRPEFRLIDNTDINFGGFGFNARWAFGDK